MEWDLYLDESGAFEDKPEHTLIGGFVCPHEKMKGVAVFNTWKTEIQQTGCAGNIFTSKILENGAVWHKVKPPCSGKPDTRTNAAKQECDRIKDEPRYVFDHCCENVTENAQPLKNRWATENWVLSQYLQKITDCGGYVVIFDNPQGHYKIDSNTTYLTILARGIIKLYIKLHELYPDESVVLHIHAASRKNVTRAYEKNKYPISPLGGQTGVIEKGLYINQIKSCMFLNGGFSVLDNSSFMDSLRNIDIMDDIQGEPHPATIVCDYICNGDYVSLKHPEFRTTLRSALKLEVFDAQPFDFHLFNLDRVAQENRWDYGLIELCSMGFPDNLTDRFFSRMKGKYSPGKCIPAFVESFRPYVLERITMQEIAERLKLTIEKTKPYFDGNAYFELTCHMLIYLDTIYTHLGQTGDVNKTRDLFTTCIQKIPEVNTRSNLIAIFCNREIVTCTDIFQFAQGRQYFSVLKDYYKRMLSSHDELLLSFLSIRDQNDVPQSKLSEYGYAIGSFIQLITHQLPLCAENEREQLIAEGTALIPMVNEYFSLPSDISRGYQNICDFYIQTQAYDKALHALSCITGNDTAQSLTAVDQISALRSYANTVSANDRTYLYLHIMQLLHAMARRDASIGAYHWTDLLKAATGDHPLTMQSLKHLFNNRYPGISVAWHLACCMARTANIAYKETAKKLLLEAYQQIKNSEIPIGAIAVAIYAETIALGLAGILPGAKWERKAEDLLEHYEQGKANGIWGPADPFDGVLVRHPDGGLQQMLMHAAELIAY